MLHMRLQLLLLALPAGAPLRQAQLLRPRSLHSRASVNLKGEYDSLATALENVIHLRCSPGSLEAMGCAVDQDSRLHPTADEDDKMQTAMWDMIGRDPKFYVSGLRSKEPSFTRLFTHDTWSSYTGRPPIIRWLVVTKTWRFSTVLFAVFPISALATLWALAVTSLPAALLPRTSPVPMSLMGTALGLLLVFRTNNSYLRLAEARKLWSSLLIHLREIGQGVATALLWDPSGAASAEARDSAARICRYLACIAWELRARLMGGLIASDTAVLDALLDPEEAAFISQQRLKPLALLPFLRHEIHEMVAHGHLAPYSARKLEEEIRSIGYVVGSCERIFSSPLPPTMSRHVIRCLQLWLLGFPFVLAGTMAPPTVAIWVFATSYAFVGIDEVGVQVEQPFDILPMNKLCLVAMANLEEAFVNLPPAVRTRLAAGGAKVWDDV